MKKYLLGGFAAAGLLLGGLAINSGIVSAQSEVDDKPGQEVCPDLESGHKKPPTEATTFLLKADPGFLITEYCVKAGSDTSVPDGAVVYVDLRLLPSGPLAEVVLNGPGGKNISHYSFSQAKPPPPSNDTTTTTTTTTTTLAPQPEEQPTTTPAPAQPAATVAAAGPVPPAAAPAAAPAPAQSALPSTGSSSWGLALTALASLLGGLGLVKLSRRTS